MKSRVLLVDDEESFVDTLAERLRNRDFDVATALRGEEALEKIKEYNFDVAIIDALMPGLGGIETLKEVKRLKPLTEVIMLTGHATVETAIEGMKLGAYDYLMKPCEIDTLVEKIKKAYARKAEHEENIEKAKMQVQVIEVGKLASMGELAAGVAHEVNNPVAIMMEEAGWIEDLLGEEESQKGENLDEIKRALKQIKAQGERCKQITHKLLSFARKTHSQLSDLQLNELIEEVVGLSQRTARYSNVRIETELDSNIPPITASPSEVQQVLLNLINNAIDAVGKDGGKIKVSTRMDNDNVVIDVSDTGCGIPESHIQRIFDPFFTTKPVGHGTGLGLSICYGIVDRMGGKIAVRSSVEKGTTFSVRLPIQPNDKEINDIQR